ncbi:MAG: ketoacyl-ACP synthase III [Deltaproteobacteria bacterium]|nr:ketoacyl-ACP synthase III [Deltaproteobacteria bacterium]
MSTYSHIIGTGSAAPERVVTNRDLEQIVDTSDDWIVRRTGIRERRISSLERPENTAEMATKAAREALEAAGMEPDELDMIVVGTVTPDRQFPATGCMVQTALGAGRAAAFDISAGCSGFLYALNTVHNAVRCGAAGKALVIGVERLSSVLNWEDRGTCVLLGDGAGAVVVSAGSDNGGILSTHIRSDGQFWDLLYAYYGENHIPDSLDHLDAKPFKLRMEGNRLFKRAIGCLTEIAVEALEHNGMTSRDIKLVVPHQANIRIIQGMIRNLGIPMEQVYTNVDRFGNTSSASIPIALNEARREGLLTPGDHVLLVSFGAGLTWASAVIRWSMEAVLSEAEDAVGCAINQAPAAIFPGP